MFNIMVVEDEKNIRTLISAVLKNEGYHTLLAENGEEALRLSGANVIDLIILDVMMPKMNGFEFAKALRDGGSGVPILMITAKHLIEDKKKGFNLGVDDYMVKPIDEEEMLLRVKALLRRAKISNEKQIIIGGAVLDYNGLTVTKNGVSVPLPKKEFYILYKLLSYPDTVFTRFQLMDEFWGIETESLDHTVDVHVNRLRKRLENFSEFEIITIRGLGYKAVKKV